MRLVRERPDWRLVMHGSLARYETVWRDQPLETARPVDIPAGAPLRVARTLDFGRYRLEVSQDGGMAVTSYRFRSGWASSDSPDVPDRADVSADRRLVPAGQSVRIHIAPPFAGEATLLVLTDRVLLTRDLTVAAGGTDIDVPVEAVLGSRRLCGGACVPPRQRRHAARPRHRADLGRRRPGFAHPGGGVAAPDRAPPRARTVIPVHTAPGAWVTLAAVDEGILRLTRFVSPDPVPHFLGRRTLGIDIRDDWGRLIAPPEGEAALLRQGGDDGSFVLPDIPLRTVTLFTPPVQAGPDGVASVPLDLPDFNGQVRLMAVAWQGSRIGAGSTEVIVRDPLVAEALLPRFLAPGDEARLAVLLHNLDLPSGEAVARMSVQGPLALAGTDRLAVNLATGAQSVPGTVLRGTGAGRGLIRLEATGPGGFSVAHDYALTVRPARGPASVSSPASLPPGPRSLSRRPSAVSCPARHGPRRVSAPRCAMTRRRWCSPWRTIRWSCLEQATSRGFPLARAAGRPAGRAGSGRPLAGAGRLGARPPAL